MVPGAVDEIAMVRARGRGRTEHKHGRSPPRGQRTGSGRDEPLRDGGRGPRTAGSETPASGCGKRDGWSTFRCAFAAPFRSGGSPLSAVPPERWTDWTEVDDREELRRRLEWLADSETLNEPRFPFLLFFFRASDPLLYPPAAAAVGRRLDRSETLRSWLEDYAGARHIPLGGRVPLTGARNRRRVLLAGAAAMARDPTSWRGLSGDAAAGTGPLDPLPPELPLETVGDCVAYLRAVRLLADGADPPDVLPQRIREVVREVGARTELLRERSVAISWGRLLALAGEPGGVVGRDEAVELGRSALSALGGRFEDPDAEDVGERLATLRAVDGVLRGAGGVLGADDLPPPLRPPVPGLGGSAGPADPVRAELVERFGELADPRRWWSRPETERACTLFALLAGVSEAVLSARELDELMDAFDCPASPRPAARVLRLAAEREGIEAGEFVDPGLLHSLQDEEILLQLVPADRPGEEGAVLADALEHRIRMGLATEPEFRPEILLARLEVRRPHPGFVQLLRTVVGDREFTRRGGEGVSLASWLEGLEAEARLLREGDAGALSEVPPVPGPLGEVRREIRRCLLGMLESSDPLELVGELVQVLEGGRSGDESGRPRDVRSLLLALEGGEGEAPETLHDHVEAIREEVGSAVPDRLSGAPEARSAVETIRIRLAAIASDLAPRLPAPEAALLSAVLRRADDVENAWLRALDRVEDAWESARPAPEEERCWSEVLQAVAAVRRPAHRRRLLAVAWRTLAEEAAGDPETEEEVAEARMRSERLVRWAIGSGRALPEEDDREAWLESVAGTWTGTLEAAMEEGLETRVARLVRHSPPRDLAGLPGIDDVLKRVRIWFYDCYRPRDAARVSRILSVRRGGGSSASLPGELFRFFVHYSPIWLALLVGALLMLDFGDPWTAMAEVADVQGIAVTFALGVLGAFAYVTAELHSRVRDGPGDRVWLNRGRRVGRVSVFVLVALLYTATLVSLLWWLLSGTDAVVHGEGAVLHIVVWSGFALFVGVFLGLMAKEGI